MQIVYYFARTKAHLIHSLRAKDLEWICTLGGVLIGYALAQPADTFAMSHSWDTIRISLAQIGVSENAVGWSIMTLAVVRFVILGYNGLWESSPFARRLLAGAFALLWFMIFLGLFSSVGFDTTGTGIYLAMLAGEFLNIIQTSHEAGIVTYVMRRGEAVSHDADRRN